MHSSLNCYVCIVMQLSLAAGFFFLNIKCLSTYKELLFSSLECSPNFPGARYFDIRNADAWTNCFITLSKRSMQQLT